MNNQDLQFTAQKIRAQYTERQPSELDALRALDQKVKRPANIFSYILGSLGAIVLGMGMSLVMTDIGAILGVANTMVTGIVLGVVGLALTVINYPLHKSILQSRKQRYASKILELSDKIINK